LIFKIPQLNPKTTNFLLKIKPFFAPLLSNFQTMSMRFFLLFFIGFSYTLTAQSPVFNPPLSPRIANYDIAVSLNENTKILTGKETLRWKNPSADTIREMHFHLYLNAFKNNKSTWLSEAGGVPSHAMAYEEEENIWGYCELQKVVDEAGNDLTNSIKFIQPEDDNEWDKTVAVVTLKNPVLPYETAILNIDFESKLPRAMVRTGYSKDYHFVVQWFPKLGVYEPIGMRGAEVGRWNCHQYHRSVEYYANFGVYNVDINVPDNYVVGASGQLVDKTEDNNRATHSYHVEDVIDFAWTACPHFLDKKDDWKGVDIRLLIHPEHEHLSERYLFVLKKTMNYFERKFEKYPYPTLTIVVTPLHGVMTSSMEYPTLFSAPALAHIPDGIRVPETLTVHEFVHQYFMQMVATNEQEEAWLDEGMTNFYEGKVLDEIFGKQTSTLDLFDIQYGNIESNRASYFDMNFPQIAPNSWVNWAFPAGTSHDIQYSKTTLWLRTLEGLVGETTFDEIMKTYFLKWKFKHPSGQDFIDVANQVVAKNHPNLFISHQQEAPNPLDWFFEQVVYGTGICDYEIGYIQHKKIFAPTGIFADKQNPILSKDADESKSGLESSVLVYRSGDLQFPVDILVRFSDGEEVLEKWDGQARFLELKYDKWIECAVVDPDHKIYLDKNLNNNSRNRYPKSDGLNKYVSKFMFYLQNVMETMSFFI
jgi:hypothetical protein